MDLFVIVQPEKKFSVDIKIIASTFQVT